MMLPLNFHQPTPYNIIQLAVEFLLCVIMISVMLYLVLKLTTDQTCMLGMH